MRKWWHLLVFTAALTAGLSLVLMLTVDMSERQMILLEKLDLLVLGIFAVDLSNEYRNYKGSGIKFTREHWLDILAVIPIFRVIRIAEIVKLERLAKLEEISEVRRGMDVEEVVSESIHTRHLKGKNKNEK